MVSIKNLSFTYESGTAPALKDINLTINDGDFVGIIGESGAGKSTLTYTLNGLIPHHFDGDFYGSVNVNGLDTFENKPDKLSLYVGSVFQDIDSRMVASIVEDEILFGLENFSVPKDEIEARITSSLDAVGIGNLRKRAISSLSGGQKQKVAVAAIIALKPAILLLDEPTGELDPQSSVQIFQLLKQLNEELGMTIIIVEQKIMLLCEYAKRLIVMDKGTVAYDGEVKEILKNTEELENLGVNVPRTVTLCDRLSKENICEKEICVSIHEAEDLVRRITNG